MPQKPLLAALIAAAVSLLVLLRVFLRRRSRRKQLEEISQLRRRDEALTEALRNPQMDAGPSGAKGPIEISWDDKAVREQAPPAALMFELVELSAYSRRKYVFRADQPVTIGSGEGSRLVLCRDGVAASHCEIRMNGSQACVRSLSEAKTVLIRGKTSALVSAGGVYLNNGDRIQVGESEILFKLFKA